MHKTLGVLCLKHRRPAYSRFTKIVFVLALVASVLFVCVPSALAADPPSVEWSKTYGGLQARSVVQTSDGGYAIAGTASLIKTDSSGNAQWEKALGDAVCVVQNRNSGYVLFCENGNIITTDSDGNLLSTISVGLTGALGGFVATDGNYILVGNTLGDGETYAWLRKIDAYGNIIWDKNFTGGFHISATVETDDRGCALAGNWKTDFWLARLDSNGNQQWSQTYAYGGIADVHLIYSMAKTRDGGFILAGAGDWQSSGGMVPWLLKMDSEGHEQWSLPYGQYPQDSFNAVVQTSDEGYLVAQAEAATLTRMDSSGGELWKVDLGSVGASSLYSSCLIRTSDGGYAIAGTASGNAFLIKISAEADMQGPVVVVSSPKSKTYEMGDLQLAFTVNELVQWLGYSLDDASNVTILGNTTVTGLAVGTHNLTVYARDLAGLVGTSATIQFTIAARFPTEMVVAGVAIAAASGIILLLYAKRRNLYGYKKLGLKNLLKKQNLASALNNRIAWTLIIISLCFILVFVQIFFPYFYYSSLTRKSNSPFEVGVSYVYEQDSIGQIYSEVSRIKNLGFEVIRVNLVCQSVDPNNYLNTETEVFISAIKQLDMRVALKLNNHDLAGDIDYYLGRWGKDLTYIQILNEPDVASSWEPGALFTDDEAGSRFDEIYSIVQQHQLSALLYTNFGPAFVARTNLPVRFSEKLDFVGYDVFMDSLLTLSPNMVQLLHKITNKEIVIAEFGMSTSNDQEQSNYLIKGLSLFKNMGVRGCWLVYWNSVSDNYGIRGRLTEQKVGEWIAQNA